MPAPRCGPTTSSSGRGSGGPATPAPRRMTCGACQRRGSPTSRRLRGPGGHLHRCVGPGARSARRRRPALRGDRPAAIPAAAARRPPGARHGHIRVSVREPSLPGTDPGAYARLLAAGDPDGTRPIGQLVERLATPGGLRGEAPAAAGEVTGLAYDSRAVDRGSVFFAIPGD